MKARNSYSDPRAVRLPFVKVEAAGRAEVVPLGTAGAPRTGRVDVIDVSVRYGRNAHGLRAVERTSFAIEPGEFVALLGPSGCGKSTLLNVIAGFLKPDEGHVCIDGEQVLGPSRHCSVVFQQHSLFPWMTALDNVAFGPQMLKQPQPHALAREYLEMVGLGAHLHQYPAQLSGGQQQRVGLARALITRPDVLLLDEPFGALDAMTRALMQEQLLKLWQRDRHTTVFITHDLEEAIFLADRVAVMSSRPGRVRQWFDIGLQRPRSPDLRHHRDFQQLHRQISELIREESLKVFRGD